MQTGAEGYNNRTFFLRSFNNGPRGEGERCKLYDHPLLQIDLPLLWMQPGPRGITFEGVIHK